MDHPELEWTGRANYLRAKDEAKQIDLYVSDLLWKIVKVHYDGDFPMPSEIWNGKNKIDRRSAKQIMDDLLNNLGGE